MSDRNYNQGEDRVLSENDDIISILPAIWLLNPAF